MWVQQLLGQSLAYSVLRQKLLQITHVLPLEGGSSSSRASTTAHPSFRAALHQQSLRAVHAGSRVLQRVQCGAVCATCGRCSWWHLSRRRRWQRWQREPTSNARLQPKLKQLLSLPLQLPMKTRWQHDPFLSSAASGTSWLGKWGCEVLLSIGGCESDCEISAETRLTGLAD